MTSVPNPGPFAKGGPRGGLLERFEINGRRTAWSLRLAGDAQMIHGDALQLPDGNVLVLYVERHTKDEALARGRAPERITDAGIWSDGVMEIKPTGRTAGIVVWKWNAWEHLVQNTDEKLPGFGEPATQPDTIDINLPTGSGPVWSRATGIDYDEATDAVVVSTVSTAASQST